MATNSIVVKYRKFVQQFIDLHMYNSALFWAEKIVVLTEEPRDIYWLAQCMYHKNEYHRAVNILTSRHLEKKCILCNYLVVQCLLAAKEVSEACKVMHIFDLSLVKQNTNFESILGVNNFDGKPKHQIWAAISLLKGRVFEAMDNRAAALTYYKEALKIDVYCFEAFDELTKNQMLTSAEEQELIKMIPIKEQCTDEEVEILLQLYESKLKKYQMPIPLAKTSSKVIYTNSDYPQIGNLVNIASLPSIHSIIAKDESKDNKSMEVETPSLQLTKIKDSVDLLAAHAERLYYNCDFEKCNKFMEYILAKDPWHPTVLTTQISCLVETKDSNRLFLLGHKLVDLYPWLAISWYAVGCYYHLIHKNDYARRYLAKATFLNKYFGPAWLAYGHSFALEKEHDQAMAAYFKATQLMKGCHLPLLYIGLECGLTNNIRLADRFFNQAKTIAPNDPIILHEKGVICFQNLQYKNAERIFKEALKKIHNILKPPLPQRWVPLLNNLGHACRKLKKYDEALEYHHQALTLSPENAAISSAIGFVHSLMGNLEEAINWFHKALALERDNTFSSTMLNYVVQQFSEEHFPFYGAPSFIPKYPMPTDRDRLLSIVTNETDESSNVVSTNMSSSILDSPEMTIIKWQA